MEMPINYQHFHFSFTFSFLHFYRVKTNQRVCFSHKFNFYTKQNYGIMHFIYHIFSLLLHPLFTCFYS